MARGSATTTGEGDNSTFYLFDHGTFPIIGLYRFTIYIMYMYTKRLLHLSHHLRFSLRLMAFVSTNLSCAFAEFSKTIYMYLNLFEFHTHIHVFSHA